LFVSLLLLLIVRACWIVAMEDGDQLLNRIVCLEAAWENTRANVNKNLPAAS
jgi:hypothetical protein